MNPRSFAAGVFENGFYLRIFCDGTVRYCTVDFHKVLINHPAGTYIQVSDFRISHLSGRKTDILTVRTELRMRIVRLQRIEILRMSAPHHIPFGMVAFAPSIEYHQQHFLIYCFACHNLNLYICSIFLSPFS